MRPRSILSLVLEYLILYCMESGLAFFLYASSFLHQTAVLGNTPFSVTKRFSESLA